MRKYIILLVLLALLCSCSQNGGTGTIRLSTASARGVTAHIEYPSLLDKTWTLKAEKQSGEKIGEGTYENIVLTDEFGPFSTGSWKFTITDTDNKITGSVIKNIKPGVNTVSIEVHSKASKGTLSVEDCNFLLSKAGNVLYIDLYVDDERMNTGWVTSTLQSEDNNFYVLPTFTKDLSEGIHTVRIYYATDNGGFSSDTVSVRIVRGMTTHLSIGEHEGNMALTVYFLSEDALIS